MFFQQYYLDCLSHASYMIGDFQSGIAAVVDPQRDIEQYVSDARENGLQIQYVILTHFHADFVAGHIELRNRTGASICLGTGARAEFEFIGLRDGDVIDLGDVSLKVIATPGHTPEGISLTVFVDADPNTPHAVLTGDTLFVGDVGRPDLLASIGVSAEELAAMLYDSVHHKLAKLPDATLVYPAHGAGSLCGRSLGTEKVSTIGEQKQYNHAMQPMSQTDFQTMVLADLPPAPGYFAYDAELNRQERAGLPVDMTRSLRPLSNKAVFREVERGALILDVRDGPDFEDAHLEGAINIGLRGRFASWAGTLLDPERPMVLIADSGDEEEAVMRLGRVGFSNVCGYLDGGIQSVGEQQHLLQSIQRFTALHADEHWHSLHHPVMVDVRTEKEYAAGHIPGSVNMPLDQVPDRHGELGKAQSLVIHCQGGYRSAIACSLFQSHGFVAVHDLVGGFSAWETCGLAVEKFTSAVR